MTQQQKIIAAAASVVLLAVLAGAAGAYFGAKDEEPNLIGVGEDSITVTEVFTQPRQEDAFSYRKLVQIENTGTVPCYIRVRLEYSDSDVQACAYFSAANQGADDEEPDADTFYPADPAAANSYAENLPEGWIYIATQGEGNPTAGYYYYTKPVAPNAKTEALISWIRMHYGDKEILAHDVFVYAESVQTTDANTGRDYAGEENGWRTAWSSFTG